VAFLILFRFGSFTLPRTIASSIIRQSGLRSARSSGNSSPMRVPVVIKMRQNR
jgi:hypothetical protein